MMEHLLDDLNSQQRTAVTAGLGQALVLAGPGSGKTRVLTRRIAYLVQAMGVRPYQILAVTFTNKAAREMRNRLDFLGETDSLWLGTFHSICARILRREASYLPFDTNFVIMDADDQLSLVRSVLKTLNLDEKEYRPNSLHAAISNAKNNLILPKDYSIRTFRDEVTARVYTAYQAALQANNALDFDDLLLWGVQLFDQNPAVREQYGKRFVHVLVDEFQDTNLAQYQLLGHLASYHHNIFVVGDEDQSIYRWRGADYRNILRFENDNPRSQKILLEKNYRSTQTILDAARAVIDRNPNRTQKFLSSARNVKGEQIVLEEAADDHAEAVYVVDTIRQWTNGGKARGSDFAVMYRTNAQSRLLEEAFLSAGLPYHLVGAMRFYGRREVKDLIAYLRLVFNPLDEVSLMRAINVPPRKIGAKTISELQNAARRSETCPGYVLLDMGHNLEQSAFWGEFSGRSAPLLVKFGAQILKWNRLAAEDSLPAVFDSIINDINYYDYLIESQKDRQEGEDRWDNVQELRRLAYEYQERGIASFLEYLALVSDQDTLPEQSDAPTLLTLHAAKGLEFNQVFIVGLDEGLLPHSRSLYDDEEMAEERRLFYVGLTRAKNRLYLVRADRRSAYGTYETSLPSRFLEDIPVELLQSLHGRRVRVGSPLLNTPRRWEVPAAPGSARPAAIIQPRYTPGMRVFNERWGEGLIVASRLEENDEVLDVAFESVGFKRLLASLAGLEIVG